MLTQIDWTSRLATDVVGSPRFAHTRIKQRTWRFGNLQTLSQGSILHIRHARRTGQQSNRFTEPKRSGRSPNRTWLKRGRTMSTIHSKNSRCRSYLFAVFVLTLLGGCASSPTEYSEAEYQVDSREEARDLDCAVNETPSCVERMGRPTKCFCSSKDDLERIFEDPLYEEDTFRR